VPHDLMQRSFEHYTFEDIISEFCGWECLLETQLSEAFNRV